MRRLWERIVCRHQWQEHWWMHNRYWECEKCGALS